MSFSAGLWLGVTLQRLVFFCHPALKALTFRVGQGGVAKPAVMINDLPMALYDEGIELKHDGRAKPHSDEPGEPPVAERMKAPTAFPMKIEATELQQPLDSNVMLPPLPVPLPLAVTGIGPPAGR